MFYRNWTISGMVRMRFMLRCVTYASGFDEGLDASKVNQAQVTAKKRCRKPNTIHSMLFDVTMRLMFLTHC